jgi:conjugal transfer/entry exclusion protein
MSEDDVKTKVHQVDMERYLAQLTEYNKEKQEYQKTYQQEYQKTYRQKHREDMVKKSNEKLKCECGGCYTYSNKSNHVATQKHIKYLRESVVCPEIVNTETI